jgi:N-acetylmuramoyl-L-alanine amidase
MVAPVQVDACRADINWMHTRAFTAFAAIPLAVILLAGPSIASAAFAHVITPGESLSSVAESDGLSVAELAVANGLSSEAPLIAGSILLIPPQPTTQAESTAGSGESPRAAEVKQEASGAEETPPRSAEAGAYVVQPGDTLGGIAARDDASVEALAELNGIDPQAPLLSGSLLKLPAGSSDQSVAAGEGQPSPAEVAIEPPYPTDETVSPAEVRSIAAEQGVPPSLAEAIAKQESGFNNGLTSSADARGVMQILPATWRWISQDLAGPTPLEPASATSNVRGGVLLLRRLLAETEGDPALAAAGYIQGLQSVRQKGEAPETEQYVSDVLALQSRIADE